MITSTYQSEAEARAARDAILSATDWTQLPDAEQRITHLCVENYRRYRAQVYSTKHQSGWPLSVKWPDVPAIERQEDAEAAYLMAKWAE